MKKHLNKKTLCMRTIESFKYNSDDQELYNMSLINHNRINTDYEKHKCEHCKKGFANKSNLNRHYNKCIAMDISNQKYKKTDENEIPNIVNHITDNTINNITDNSVNNITDNSTTNINLNINIIKSFDEEWSVDHIDDKDKLILLFNNSKFTSMLQNILENEVNLNVLLENNSEMGLVYNNNKLINMNIKDIVKKTMDKLYNHLCSFKKDITQPNIYNLNEKSINEEMKNAYTKYNNYRRNVDIQNNVNTFIKNIYTSKIDNTYKKYRDVAIYNSKEGF
jgi:hypothetical protein